MRTLREQLVKLASEQPGLRPRIVPLLKTAGWEVTVVNPGKQVTDKMIETLVIGKAEYLGVIKGSLKWEPKPRNGTDDFSVEWHWNMKGIDPTDKQEYNIRGMLKIRMNLMKGGHEYEAWIGVHV